MRNQRSSGVKRTPKGVERAGLSALLVGSWGITNGEGEGTNENLKTVPFEGEETER